MQSITSRHKIFKTTSGGSVNIKTLLCLHSMGIVGKKKVGQHKHGFVLHSYHFRFHKKVPADIESKGQRVDSKEKDNQEKLCIFSSLTSSNGNKKAEVNIKDLKINYDSRPHFKSFECCHIWILISIILVVKLWNERL